MQTKTFHIIVVVCMLIAFLYPAVIWISPSSGFFDLRSLIAAVMVPVLWIFGNLITGFMVLINRKLATPLFKAQCVGSLVSLLAIVLMALFFFAGH